MRFLAVGIILFSLQASAVWNGAPVADNEHVSVVHIVPDGAKRACTATIISSSHLLTAAHCLEGVVGSGESIKVSRAFDGRFARKFKIRRSYQVLKYDGNGEIAQSDIEKDIAIIDVRADLLSAFKLAVTDLPSLLPVDLESFLGKSNGELLVTAVGYGDFEKNNEGEKRSAQVRVRELGAGQISVVAEQAGQGLCHGDSGGGLFLKMEDQVFLVGVLSGISQGVPCGDKNSVAFYARSTAQLCWIAKITKNENLLSSCQEN